MLRNSTDKYKRMYGSTPVKDSKTMSAIGTPTKVDTQSHINYSVKSLSSVKCASTKKLETCKVFNEKNNFVYKYGFQTKEQVIKLRKTTKRFHNVSKKAEQKQYRTCEDHYLEQQPQVVEIPRDSEDFIQNMPKNSLFFCTHCFQFVFDIEKKRHYPQCKDAIVIKNRDNEEFYNLARRKLQTIVELSKYTETKAKEIQNLYESVELEQFQLIERIMYPKSYQFFKLDEIEKAFAYTYNNLVKGIKLQTEITLFTCF